MSNKREIAKIAREVKELRRKLAGNDMFTEQELEYTDWEDLEDQIKSIGAQGVSVKRVEKVAPDGEGWALVTYTTTESVRATLIKPFFEGLPNYEVEELINDMVGGIFKPIGGAGEGMVLKGTAWDMGFIARDGELSFYITDPEVFTDDEELSMEHPKLIKALRRSKFLNASNDTTLDLNKIKGIRKQKEAINKVVSDYMTTYKRVIAPMEATLDRI